MQGQGRFGGSPLGEGRRMKRIVVLIDGTWNKEGTGGDTNVAKLDSSPIGKLATRALIKPSAADGTLQNVHYHDGVGAEGGWVARLLGGAIGLGLKQIIKECYELVVDDYASGDEIYILGFSRGAYAARALAGLIGASGIQRSKSDQLFEVAWKHYRVAPAARRQADKASSGDQKAIADYRGEQQAFHDDRSIRCVGVWDTVGSYGIPAGFGLAALARYVSLAFLGFHDTSFGDHVAVGLHAIAVDEHRRPFVPTFWTIPRGQEPKGHVEQIWFAGAHCNVGGGYADSGLSDLALIWMIARIHDLTGLELDPQQLKSHTAPDINGAVVDSTEGWPLDHLLPHYRTILSPVAIHHGYMFNTDDNGEEHINERVHWSVVAKHAATGGGSYNPPNLPASIPPDKIADKTDGERALLPP
jgi:uncharacterized protein (DUF2235 family)